MSIFYIKEYPETGMFQNGLNTPLELGTDQVFSFTATAGQSATLNQNTRMVRVTTDAPFANLLFGTNPTAVAGTSLRIQAGQSYDFLVPRSSGLKISAVTAGA